MPTRREPRPIIAYGKCPMCGARVALFRNTAGRVYGYCQGNDDPNGKACGGDWRNGRTHSENIIRAATAASEAQGAPAPAPASSPAPASDKVTHEHPPGPDRAQPAKPAERKRAGLFD